MPLQSLDKNRGVHAEDSRNSIATTDHKARAAWAPRRTPNRTPAFKHARRRGIVDADYPDTSSATHGGGEEEVAIVVGREEHCGDGMHVILEEAPRSQRANVPETHSVVIRGCSEQAIRLIYCKISDLCRMTTKRLQELPRQRRPEIESHEYSSHEKKQCENSYWIDIEILQLPVVVKR